MTKSEQAKKLRFQSAYIARLEGRIHAESVVLTHGEHALVSEVARLSEENAALRMIKGKDVQGLLRLVVAMRKQHKRIMDDLPLSIVAHIHENHNDWGLPADQIIAEMDRGKK